MPPGDPRIAEGLMLKRRDSLYEAGRPKGPWFEWKRDPHLVAAADVRPSAAMASPGASLPTLHLVCGKLTGMAKPI